MAKGNIILLNDGLYSYTLPPEPSDEKLIQNYDKKKSDQVWQRPVIFPVREIKKWSEKQRIEYIDGLRDKWLNGHWVFIDGELVWISGMHWDFMVMSKYEFGYPDYLEQQRFDFYFRDLVRKDDKCYGKAILKCRRCGFTAQEIEESIYTLIEDDSCHVGLQSNEYKKCLTTLVHPLIQTYVNRPLYMRERFYAPNGKKPRNSLELITSKIDVMNEDPDDYLGGTALPYPTTAAAMDGTKKKLIVQDESFKWIGCDPEETLDINKKCVVEYGIKGKVDVVSTMGDSDDVVEAVKKGCKIIYDSNPKVRDPNGRTTSGLYEWFVGAIHSADIPEEYRDPAYTKFGKINKDKATQYVLNEVNKYPLNSKQRVFAMRRLPLEKKHGLMAATSKQYFPLLRMQSRLDDLNQLPKNLKPYVIGNLTEDARGRITFEADEEGIWLMSLLPFFSEEKNIDTRNRFRVQDGVFFPPINPEGCIGYDPVRYKTKNTTSSNLSLACAIAYKKFDYFGSGFSNQFAGLMLYRPDDPEDAHREVCKGAKFFGYPVMAERQVETTENIFKEQSMIPFLLSNPKDNIWGMWTTDKTTENGVQKLNTVFSPPKNEIDTDQVDIYPFEAGLIDYTNFDMLEPKKSHVTLASIMLVNGLEQINFTNFTDQSHDNTLERIHEVIRRRTHVVNN